MESEEWRVESKVESGEGPLESAHFLLEYNQCLQVRVHIGENRVKRIHLAWLSAV